MNTPAHAILNLLVLGRRGDTRGNQTAILTGALLPDAPMFLFYFAEKMVNGTAESQIWGEKYHLERWQSFFDLFNSLPIIAALFVAGIALKIRNVVLIAASMALHVAGDLPLHHDDGHRHFFPLSDWRFESPFSYWDPAHHGTIIGWIEIAMVVGASLWIIRRSSTWFLRIVTLGVLVAYASYIGYALTVWVSMD